MTRRNWRALVAAAVALALGLPILFTLGYARHAAVVTVQDRARIYATEVLHRSDATTDQVQSAVDRLAALPGEPCDGPHLALMREIDVGSSYVQAVGHVSGDALVCSSLGLQRTPVPLGAVDFVTAGAATIRTDVQLAPAEPTTFVVVEQKGYAAVLHKQLPLDVANDDAGLSLGTFAFPSGRPFTVRGLLSPTWVSRGSEGQTTAFMDGSRAVAVAGSRRWHLGAVGALPPSAYHHELARQRWQLLPPAVLVGVVLATMVLLLARRRLALTAELRAALRRHELYLEYQPVVELQTSKVVGAEALLRWRRPDGRLVRPDLFIPAAEDSGLMPRITRRVLELVRADWPVLSAGRPGFHVAINISSKDIHDEGVVEDLTRLRELGPGAVIVEVTERIVLDRDSATAVFARLRACGIEIAIDDFGTGYSSLSYLQSLPLDYLKIDKSFVDSLGAGAATSNVALHIIEMAGELDLRLIAEGVETEQQADFLRNCAVQYAQGWLFGRPAVPERWAAGPGAGTPWPGRSTTS